jgi:hypothetical protein
MLERDFEEIPDLQFNIELLICDPPHVASRLRFDCRPKGLFLGLPSTADRSPSPRTSSIDFAAERSKRSGRRSTRRRSKRSFQVRPIRGNGGFGVCAQKKESALWGTRIQMRCNGGYRQETRTIASRWI